MLAINYHRRTAIAHYYIGDLLSIAERRTEIPQEVAPALVESIGKCRFRV